MDRLKSRRRIEWPSLARGKKTGDEEGETRGGDTVKMRERKDWRNERRREGDNRDNDDDDDDGDEEEEEEEEEDRATRSHEVSR